MTFKRNTGGAHTDVTTTVKRHNGSTWLPVLTIKRHNGAGWTTVWSIVSLSNASVSYASATFNTEATYTIKSDGTISKKLGSTTTSIGTWKNAGVGSDFEVRATLNSGDTPVGTLATWTAVSSDQSWTLQSVSGIETCDLTIELRSVSGSTAASATITITSEKL